MNGIHFIGAGGVGVSGLAHLALDAGCAVSASDIADSAMLETLRARGVDCFIGHRDALPDGTRTVVFSSAVPESDAERRYAAMNGIRQVRRGDFLSELAEGFECRIAVSGSHGKTTTTAMVAHILRMCGIDAGYMVGGIVNGWRRAAFRGDGGYFVSEVDESDGSQAGFPADIALVMNIEDDHCWSVGGIESLERSFVQLCRGANHILCWESNVTRRVFGGNKAAVFISQPLDLPELIGWHNKLNGAMAVAAAELCGVPRKNAMDALRSFPGVSRRLSVRATLDGRVLIEDYAHHPTELKATIDALKERYPEHFLMILFQPHRNERVQRYGRQFGKLLSRADWIGLMDAFGAWRTDGQFCDVRNGIGAFISHPYDYFAGKDFGAIADVVRAEWLMHDKCVLAIIGAGDITKIIRLISKF